MTFSFFSFALEVGLGWVGLGRKENARWKGLDNYEIMIYLVRERERERDLLFASSTNPGCPGMIVRSKTTCRSVYEAGSI